ncbi:MAG: hypothetical protein AAF467_08375 [Actinomycetota bacterium]
MTATAQYLQRAAGNRATASLVSRQAASPARPSFESALNDALQNLRADFGVPFRAGAFDSQYWIRVADPGRFHWMLRLKAGVSAYDAIDELVTKSATAWNLECATAVQVAQMYAQAKSQGKAAYDGRFTGRPFVLRFFESSGVRRKYFFDRETKNGKWFARYRKPGESKSRPHPVSSRWNDATILAVMPVGSRVMWRNQVLGPASGSSWRNENTVKVGPDRFRGFPLFDSKPVPSQMIKLGMAAHQYASDHRSDPLIAGHASNDDRIDVLLTAIESNPNQSALAGLRAYVAANVFLSEAVSFR